MRSFDLQGHRGARGLKPENTLPAFETALDLGVSTLELDLHLTRDDVPVITHEPFVLPQLARIHANADVPPPDHKPLVRSLSLTQLQRYAADVNPDKRRWHEQTATPTPVAQAFLGQRQLHPFAMPSLAHLFAFVKTYAASPDKSAEQRQGAEKVRFNVELKRVPGQLQLIGDDFAGTGAGVFERRVLEVIREQGMVARVIVQSFDHRAIKAIRELEPKLVTAALIAETAPFDVAQMTLAAGAAIYSPDVNFLDKAQVRQAHAKGVLVIPWTVNEPDDVNRLLDLEVDGMITDYPNRVIPLLQMRHRHW